MHKQANTKTDEMLKAALKLHYKMRGSNIVRLWMIITQQHCLLHFKALAMIGNRTSSTAVPQTHSKFIKLDSWHLQILPTIQLQKVFPQHNPSTQAQ